MAKRAGARAGACAGALEHAPAVGRVRSRNRAAQPQARTRTRGEDEHLATLVLLALEGLDRRAVLREVAPHEGEVRVVVLDRHVAADLEVAVRVLRVEEGEVALPLATAFLNFWREV